MIAWENDLLTGSPSVRAVAGRLPAPPGRGSERPIDGQGRAWRGKLWRDLIAAVLFYCSAHFLFSLHWLAGGTLKVTLDLGVAQVLILLGTLLLWRVTQLLNDPPATRHPAHGRHAAWCLAIAMALSFSPSIWWFVFRA
jgi:hypothetical protein